MLVSIQLAGTPGAGLHFIKNQRCFMLIAQLAQRLQELRIRRHDAAFADNRLDDDRASAGRERRFHRVDIVIRQMGDVLR